MSVTEHGHVDHMTDFEALMWELEKSPALSNTFSNVTILDRPADRARLKEKMRVAARKVPRLHQRPVAPVGRLANPTWVNDPDFDLDHHLRWVNLGGEASEEELYDFVASAAAQPLDRERPLWDFTIVEGLRGGGAAMIQRLHHTITDGEGGIRLSIAFLDLERSGDVEHGESGAVSESNRPTDDQRPAEPAGDQDHDQDDPDHDQEGDGFADAVRAITDSVRLRGGQVIDAIGSAGSLMMRPGDAADLAASAGRQMRVTSRCSELWTERSLSRWFGTTELDLAEVKAAAHRLGGSVNDFFVTGAAAGAGEYHRLRDAPVEQLRMSMPVSIRHQTPSEERGDPMAGGNAFSPTQVMVPTDDMAPEQRFAMIHDRLDDLRSEPAMNALGGAAAVINLLPTAALLATGEWATGGIDFVCSNVRAAPFDLFIGGALIEANYPVGPLAGTAFNLTTMSYRGSLFLGLHVDSVAIAEPASLLESIEAGYGALLEAAASR